MQTVVRQLRLKRSFKQCFISLHLVYRSPIVNESEELFKADSMRFPHLGFIKCKDNMLSLTVGFDTGTEVFSALYRGIISVMKSFAFQTEACREYSARKVFSLKRCSSYPVHKILRLILSLKGLFFFERLSGWGCGSKQF